MLAWFKRAFSEWSEVWQELFKNAALPFIPRPIYCMPLDQTWEALELSANLVSGKFACLREAIAAFETGMRNRAAIATKESLENGELMHSENALDRMPAFFGHKGDTNSWPAI